MSLGENIKRFRESRGYSQPELAEMIGVSYKTISSWEIDRTEPNIGTLIKISNIFNVCVDDLIENFSVIRQPSIVAYNGSDKKVIEVDDFYYSLFNEMQNLTDEQKEALLSMAKAFNKSK